MFLSTPPPRRLPHASSMANCCSHMACSVCCVVCDVSLTATHCNTLQHQGVCIPAYNASDACNTLQHTHCNTQVCAFLHTTRQTPRRLMPRAASPFAVTTSAKKPTPEALNTRSTTPWCSTCLCSCRFSTRSTVVRSVSFPCAPSLFRLHACSFALTFVFISCASSRASLSRELPTHWLAPLLLLSLSLSSSLSLALFLSLSLSLFFLSLSLSLSLLR